MTEDAKSTGLSYYARLLFGLELKVTRKAYIVSGFSLMLVKFAMDATVVYFATGQFYSPLRFLSPMVSARLPDVVSGHVDSSQMALGVMAIYALVFMWIGVSMSVRRASNAGKSPWLGLMFLVPIANVPVMLLLAAIPDVEQSGWLPTGGYYRAVGTQASPEGGVPHSLGSAMKGVLAGVLIGASMVGLSAFGLAAYGTVLFFFTPFIMGAVTSYLYNLRGPQGLGKSLGMSLVPVAITGLGILLLALEGLICIAMATPIALVIALFGGLIGYAIPRHSQASLSHSVMLVMTLPALANVEARLAEPVLYETVSSIEIDAPPSEVWPNVIGFSVLPPPTELEFQIGIAYPLRAHIEGTGVGAVRHCVFSTGAFVEPITRWEPPSRLSFDVSAQPPAMQHWSPVRHFHGYHIGESIRSQRGEFRLTALPGGRTRLEGSTWYELHMAPAAYWSIWSDGLIHAIHARVLRHIKHLSE